MKPDAIKNVDIVSVIMNDGVPLKQKGDNFTAPCPLHGERTGSFVVSMSRQKFKCFGCGKSGDAADYLEYRYNLSKAEAFARLSGDDSIVSSVEVREAVQKLENKNTFEQLPKFDGEVQPTYRHSEHGVPTEINPYKNLNNEVIGYTCKFILPDGSKQVLPYIYGYFMNNNAKAWRYMGFNSPRPIYGMEFVGAFPDATVVIVEGEKCANFGNSRMMESMDYKGKYVFVSWIGGSDSVSKTDFSVLSSKNVVLWRDNDEPGVKAVKQIHANIGGRFLDIPTDKPKGWDIADESWSMDGIVEFIESNTVVKLQPVKSTDPTPEVVIPEPIRPATREHNGIGEGYFRVLGYNKNDKGSLSYWFYTYEHQMVVSYSPSSLTKPNLMTLAPIQWWQSKFHGGGAGKIDMDAAAQSLMHACQVTGVFNEEKIRGRGAWRDGSDIVLHVGDRLIVNGVPVQLQDYVSKYMYEVNDTVQYGGSDALSNEESAKLLDMMKWFAWDNDRMPYSFAGWLIIAPFCGVLNWRPHGWLTATSGAGKTWVQDNVVKLLLGDIAIHSGGDTTSAGLRQMLQSDARPILFDESEAETIKDRERLQDAVSTLRGASSKDGAVVIKGTQNGTAKRYIIRTMALMSSIGVYLRQKADRRRFTVFSLRDSDINKGEAFERFKSDWFGLVNDEYVRRLQQRTINLLPVIIRNSEIFTETATKILGSRSSGDQLGGLLAGAYSLVSDKVITPEKAAEWLNRYDWDEEKSENDQKDEILLFDAIMEVKVRLDNNIVVTLGEIITFCATGDTDTTYLRDQWLSLPIILGRYGIKITGEWICFANNNGTLRNSIISSPWADSIKTLLKRIPGAVDAHPMPYMKGQGSKRGIKVPVNVLVEMKL